MAITTDCAEGRHDVCRGAGPNHYCPQTAHLGDQKCACRCHPARSPQDEDHGRTCPECGPLGKWNACPHDVQGGRPEQPPPDRLGGQPPAEPPEAP